ncbi:MAG: hypothetical protein K2Q22_10635, partial [Cytophagales bacterium]|nr:hypothetical protein [Cytophagales bacterium]
RCVRHCRYLSLNLKENQIGGGRSATVGHGAFASLVLRRIKSYHGASGSESPVLLDLPLFVLFLPSIFFFAFFSFFFSKQNDEKYNS